MHFTTVDGVDLYYERHGNDGTPTLIIGTHFAGATAGRIVRDGDAYRLVT